MTISSETSRSAYSANGVTTVFGTGFVYHAAADVRVILVTIATGAEALQTLTTHYTLSGGSGAAGNVTFLSAPASGLRVVILRDPDMTQALDLVAGDPLPAENLEQSLDKIVVQGQRTRDLVERSLHQGDGDVSAMSALPPAVERASKYAAYDASGNPIASSGPTGTSNVPVSAFAETLLDDANAATARATLGLVIGTDVPAVGAVVPVGAVTLSGLTMATGKILGRATAGTGAIEEITPIFSKYFESADQTITAAGQLTLAHGLGTKPKLVIALLKNVTAELGYVTDDTVFINSAGNDVVLAASRGVSIIPTTTDVVIRFGSDANTFAIINKSSGAGGAITNANWKLIIQAWA